MKEKNILKNIHLELEKDKIACLLGPSGSGKTTLLKLISGLEKVQKGKIFFEVPTNHNGRTKDEGKKIRFYHIFPILLRIFIERIKR